MGCQRLDAGPIPPRAGNVTLDSSKLARALGYEPFDAWPTTSVGATHRLALDGRPTSPARPSCWPDSLSQSAADDELAPRSILPLALLSDSNWRRQNPFRSASAFSSHSWTSPASL